MRTATINNRYLINEDCVIYDFIKKRYMKLCRSQRYITAYIDGKNMYAHILLAKSFIANPNNYPEVNHIDGVKHNIKIGNLEWCTRAYNQNHAFQIGLRDEGNTRRSKLISKKVYESKNKLFFDSVKEAAQFYGINHQTLIGKLSGHDKNNTTLNYLV